MDVGTTLISGNPKELRRNLLADPAQANAPVAYSQAASKRLRRIRSRMPPAALVNYGGEMRFER